MTIAALPVIFSILIILSKSVCSQHIVLISRTSGMKSSTPISSSPFICEIQAIASLARRFGDANCGSLTSDVPFHGVLMVNVTSDPRSVVASCPTLIFVLLFHKSSISAVRFLLSLSAARCVSSSRLVRR